MKKFKNILQLSSEIDQEPLASIVFQKESEG